MSEIAFANNLSRSLNMTENTTDLSLGQKGLWFLQLMEGDAKIAYNEPLIYTLKGVISNKAINSAMQAIIKKHAILRTAFKKDEEGRPFQFIDNQISFECNVLEYLDQDERNQYIVNEIRKPFSLDKPPLLRASLLKLSEHEYILIIVMHHIITDGRSFGILINDLNYFYKKFINDSSFTFSNSYDSKESYFNYIDYLKEKFSAKQYNLRVKEYAETLKDYSGLNFLTTPQIGQENDFYSGDRVYFTLEKDILTKIRTFSQKERATIFHFLFAAYCVFLSRYTRSNDLVIGVPFLNREFDIDQKIMGYFVNTLPLRVILDNQQDFFKLIETIRHLTLKCLGGQDLEFEHMMPHLKCDRKSSGQHPLIQTLFVWASIDKLKLELPNISAHYEHQYFSKTTKFDLSLFFLENNKETVTAYFEFRTLLFDRSIVEKLAQNFQILLKNILEQPNLPHVSCSLLDNKEKEWMKRKLFTSKLDRQVNISLAELFSKTARQYPKNNAILFNNKCYNYEILETRSNQWASYIRYKYKIIKGHEMPRDTLIALCVERSEDMIFGILGILKAGGAYVPIDPQYPNERIKYIIEHCKASLLLTHKKHANRIQNFSEDQIIYMEEEQITQSELFKKIDLNHKIYPQDVAYVLYTSGSTGKPKGVSVTHENIICLFESLKCHFQISSQDIWSLFHTYCFDISVWEIWGAFLFGGSLLIVPYETTRDPDQFHKLIESEKVTVLTQTPSAFQMFINEDLKTSKLLSHLRYVAFVGESLKVSILRPWVDKYGLTKPQLANMYGITETTVYTNYKFIEQSDLDKGRDNIGWPLLDFSMCVLDENLEWCPIGIVGEICIGGRGLSRGYLYQDDLTQEKFIPDPYRNFLNLAQEAKLYRTGDLGRWLEDGSIEYLGRKDFQIKLRGFRIELGEIESALGQFEGISHTAVLLKGLADTQYLAAFYTLKPGVKVEITKLQAYLKACLPEYMIPKTFTELFSFPITINGKVDRKILLTLEEKHDFHENNIPLCSELEVSIGKVWSDVLKINLEKISPISNFFELGGNSLSVVRMLTVLSKKLDRELSLSQFIAAPTITTILNMVSKSISPKEMNEMLIGQLAKDICLDPNIQPLSSITTNNYPEAILITGATGFLGAHLLYELLQSTVSKIYCLVRASSHHEAISNIMLKFKKYGLAYDQYQTRIIPIMGDLAQKQLGLSLVDFDKLTKEVDSIYHVGAWVHHVFDYHTLFNTNVQSVIELLKIATTEKNKTIHFISTLGTQYISPMENSSFHDTNDIMSTSLNYNGYLLSKWVSEILFKEAHSRGIKTTIYRPGNIIAGAKGIYEPDLNHTLLRLKGLLQLGKGYLSVNEKIEMMPVDLLAKAIASISKDAKILAYNLNNPQIISWMDYLNAAKKHGFSFDFLEDETEWKQLLKGINEDNAFYKLSQFYSYHNEKDLKDIQTKNPLNIVSHFPETLPSYDWMLTLQFDSLIKLEFLQLPPKR